LNFRYPPVGQFAGGEWNSAKVLRYRPSYTRLRVPGCDAYQIDGTTFSRVVAFSAEVAK
jgi:hypothetical protein